MASTEAGAPPLHQKLVLEAGYTDTVKTLVFTGRPMRVKMNDYIKDWHDNRSEELKQLLKQGKLPYTVDVEKVTDPTPEDLKRMQEGRPWLMGSVGTFLEYVFITDRQLAGAIHEIKPAADIMNEMTRDAVKILKNNVLLIKSRL